MLFKLNNVIFTFFSLQEGFSHCASEACSFLLSLPGLDSVVGRRLVEYLAKSVSHALESQLAATGTNNKHPAAAVSPACTTIVNNNNNNNNDNHNNSNLNATASHTPPSSNPPSSPPAPPAPPTLLSPAPQVNQEAGGTLPYLPQKPVALSASNRGIHTVIRPKPTRPTFGRPSSAPQLYDAAAEAQRDPMWRPW